MLILNVFINFIKRFYIKKGIKVEIRALEKVEVLLLLALNFLVLLWLASLLSFTVRLTKTII